MLRRVTGADAEVWGGASYERLAATFERHYVFVLGTRR
jgi:hypothetical protein